ncbi:MAG: hypothetical protein D6705_03455 [Deltaproteobacteria bacterium]|nr:MAG: hypothetical protein D6705_03455 [Deltaproteobacteria bacterium]
MKPMVRRPVVLIHGALRSRLGLLPTARGLARHGLHPYAFGYPSRRGRLGDHAARLHTFLALRGLWTETDVPLGFLTHSMGALVVRAFLARGAGRRLPRPVRLVMLSPPNRGATLAARFAGRLHARLLYGDALEELAPERVARLGALPEGVAALVLAGGRGDQRGYNRWIDGDDDGVVAVADMPLAGAAFEFVGGWHALLQWRPDLLARAAAFLAEDGEANAPVPGGGLEPPT